MNWQRGMSQKASHLSRLRSIDFVREVFEYLNLRCIYCAFDILTAQVRIGFERLAYYLQARHPTLGPAHQSIDCLRVIDQIAK